MRRERRGGDGRPASSLRVRLAIYGGSFDPPHVGHLLTAVDAFERLRLDLLIFVPVGAQPLKAQAVVAPADQRLAMMQLMAGTDERFAVDPIEIDREGLSFTVDTLRAYRDRFPLAERHLLVGADVLASFDQWREPETVLQLARLAVLQRGESSGAPPERLSPAPIMLPTRRVDVSSTEIRERIASGRSIHGFVPDAVAEFIAAAGLYR